LFQKKSQKCVLQAEEKYQEEVRRQNLEVEALKMCLEVDELVTFVFATLISMLIGSIILYIVVTRPLPYEKP
jgi:Na+/glutamate symporter